MRMLDLLSIAVFEHGPWTWLVLAAGLISAFLAPILPLITGFARSKKVPASLAWALPVLTLLVAVGIGAWGVYQVSEARSAPPGEAQMLVAQNTAAILLSGWLAATLASGAFLLIGLAGALPAPIRPGPEGKIDLLGVGGSVLGGFVGWLIAAGAIALTVGIGNLRDVGPALPVCALLAVVTGLAVLFSAIRIDKEDVEHRGRMAALRVFVGVSGFLALTLAGGAWQLLGMIEAFQAVATAASDMKQTLLAGGISIAAYATWIGGSLALVPLFAGIGACIPGLRNLQTSSAVGLVLATLLFVVTVVAWFAMATLSVLPFQIMMAG